MAKGQTYRFKAGGKTYNALKKAYETIHETYARLEQLDLQAFGPLKPRDTTTVLGYTLRNYGARPQAEWQDNGRLAGFRFDWKPLNKPSRMQYNISSIPVPDAWIPAPEKPGVFRPDPESNPYISAIFDDLYLPSLEKLPEVSGPSAIVRIEHTKGVYPRAYQEWPIVHVDRTDQKLNFYIEMPMTYEGRVFIPQESSPMTEEEWWDFRRSYGDMYEPEGKSRPRGVATPDNYLHEIGTHAPSDRRYFLLAGHSLKIYKDHLRQEKKADQAMSLLTKAWKTTGISYRGNELIGADFKGPPEKGWKKDEYRYIPDITTPEGRKLKEIFARLPQRPGLRDLQKKLTPDAEWMRWPELLNFEELGNAIILAYPATIDGKDILPPPDAEEISSQVIGWLRADQLDKSCGINPPPIPPPLRPALDEFLQKIRPAAKNGKRGNDLDI